MKKAKPVHLCRHRRGFVLLELIVALTIFALVSLGLVTALDRAYRAAGDRNAADAAARGLRNQLVQLHAQMLAPGEVDLPDDGTGLAYHETVAPAAMLDGQGRPVLGVFRATITAAWKSDGQTESRSVTTLVYQP